MGQHAGPGDPAQPADRAAVGHRAQRGHGPRRVHHGQPGPLPDLPGVDLRQQPDQRPGLGGGLAARAVRHLVLPDDHHRAWHPAVAQDRRRRGHAVHRRTHRNAGRLRMTTNTARDVTATAAGTGQARAGGGTSVRLQGLTRAFGGTRALDGLSIEMAPGELVALLGPSGCGKTTALRIVAGFETADTGSVLIDGKDISSVPAAKRDMGMVFQSYSLFPNMSALDNVAFGLRMRKIATGERRKQAAGLLDMVGLAPQASQYPHQLSGGQQQRVALARALAIQPRVLLLDEPLSALDAKVRLQLREQIRTLQQQLGTTTLFVTHDQEEALSMADRVGVMSKGRLEQIAAPDELYTDPATAFVAEFVGVMNRVPGELQSGGQD